jgi:hypothetical protein
MPVGKYNPEIGVALTTTDGVEIDRTWKQVTHTARSRLGYLVANMFECVLTVEKGMVV